LKVEQSAANTISQSNSSALTRIFSLLDKQLGSTNLCFAAGTFDPATREKLQTIIDLMTLKPGLNNFLLNCWMKF
jgi:hypothetical protein